METMELSRYYPRYKAGNEAMAVNFMIIVPSA